MRAPGIGELRHRVTIEAPLRSDDGGGAAIITWQPVVTVWARIEATAGREIVLGDTPSARSSYTVVMRYRDDVDATMRMVTGGRTFEILSARDVDGRHRWLTCFCELRGP